MPASLPGFQPSRTFTFMASNFFPEFLAYLRARKWLWLFPILAISLLLIMVAVLLFGPGVALEAFYQIF